MSEKMCNHISLTREACTAKRKAIVRFEVEIIGNAIKKFLNRRWSTSVIQTQKKESGEIGTVIDLDGYRNKNECAFGETKAEHTGKQPDKSVEGIQEAVLNLDVLKLKLELVNRFGTSESMETIRKYGKAKNGIIREVLVREG